ncbi:MAG: efflux RND transporter periplasmic adaptor subunit [Pedobacter sp.]|uniref:efflux RND transporter periplasmic adaptor subunit n=1 Tax=Pedobacter sp. TaxID=1411316 RepID=UPI002806FDE6|nr:efflux RND transporter periplasmic adaptor subunit [Pedobacter sp.]MDQ8005826.1 efflux RND transporter periplasmic adaptor subunit [Pedobacter sp.]
MIIVFLASCQTKPKKDHHDIGKVEVDAKLKALIAPSNEQVVAKAAVVKASYETKIFTAEVQGMVNYDTRSETSVASRVGGRLEKLYIKYNYQPVKKGRLLFEIYAPDLAAAQQELIYLSQSAGDERLLAQAKQRLLLLGMSSQTIQHVLQSKKVNYRIPVYSPADGYILEKQLANNANAMSAPTTENGGDGMSGMSGGGSSATPIATPTSQVNNLPVMLREGQYVNAGQSIFTIYKADQLLAEFALKPRLGALVKKGSKMAFYKTADKEDSFQTSTIGLIQPMIKAGENFTVARVYLSKRKFKAGEILTAKIPVLVPQSYWLPESAIVNIGAQNMAFKKENGVFVSMNLNTGLRMNGLVQVKEDIANMEFAKNAAYLVDSESFIRAKGN